MFLCGFPVYSDEPPRAGAYKVYYESGELKSEGSFKNGQKNGVYKEYYQSGKLWWEEYYEDGKHQGLIKEYFQSGAVRSVWLYKDGNLLNRKTYDEDGNLRSEENFEAPHKAKSAVKGDKKETPKASSFEDFINSRGKKMPEKEGLLKYIDKDGVNIKSPF